MAPSDRGGLPGADRTNREVVVGGRPSHRSMDPLESGIVPNPYLRRFATGVLIALAACEEPVSVSPVVRAAINAPAGSAMVLPANTLSMRVGDSHALELSPGLRRSRNIDWSSSSNSVAAVNASGTVRAFQVGSAVITASGTFGEQQFPVLVEVAAPEPTVLVLSLSPVSGAALAPGETRQYTPTAYWSDGVSRPVNVTYSASGGSITTDGLYTAGPVAGSFVVFATCVCGLIASRAVEINGSGAQLQRLTVSPKMVVLAQGATQQFVVAANWSTGATDVPPVTWSTSGGSVSSSGRYTAPGVNGTYRVIVAHTGGTVRDTAMVTVSNGGGQLGSLLEPVFSPLLDKMVDTESFDGFDGAAVGGQTFGKKYSVARTTFPSGGNIKYVSAEAERAGILTITTPGYGGFGKALRLKYGGGAGASDIIVGPDARLRRAGQLDGVLPSIAGPYTHFVLTMSFRTSPGADPAAYHPSGVKGIMIFHDGGQRYERNPTRLNYKYGRWQETRLNFLGGYPENSVSGKRHWRTADGRPPLWSNYNDGAWHRVTREIYTAGDPSGLVGERCWDDGVLVFDNVGDLLTGFGPDGQPWDVYSYSNPITHWMVFGNYVRADVALASPPFWVEFDNWIAWTR